jgi:hypothetical protein
MRGIESAFWGVLGKDPELRTSKTGTPFATMNVQGATARSTPLVTYCARFRPNEGVPR